MKSFALLFAAFFVPCCAFAQQVNPVLSATRQVQSQHGVVRKPDIYWADTSDNALVDGIMTLLNRAQTVFDGQLVANKSHWRYVKNSFFRNGVRRIYTVYTFQIFHWIKGPTGGNEVSFWQWGGKIGDTLQVVSSAPYYQMNMRGIYFLGNRRPNTKLISLGVVDIFGYGHGSTGSVMIGGGTWRVNPEYYDKVLKESATDTTAYRTFIHRMKRHDIHNPSFWPSTKVRTMPADSIHPIILKEIMFQWNSVSGASNYEIEVATDDNMQNIVADGLYLEYYQSEIDALRIIRRDVK